MTYPDRKILALDMATNVGFACLRNGVPAHGEASMKRIHGLKRTPDEHLGTPYLRFRDWLSAFLASYAAQEIATEYTGFFKSAAARDICCGFRAILLEQAARRNIPVFSYAPSHIKKFWTGSGNADKPMMVAVAATRGFDAGTDAADAIAILHLHLNQTMPCTTKT